MAEQNSNLSSRKVELADILDRIENNKDNPLMCNWLYQEGVMVQNAIISENIISGADCAEEQRYLAKLYMDMSEYQKDEHQAVCCYEKALSIVETLASKTGAAEDYRYLAQIHHWIWAHASGIAEEEEDQSSVREDLSSVRDYIFSKAVNAQTMVVEQTASAEDRRLLSTYYLDWGKSELKDNPVSALKHFNEGMQIWETLVHQSGEKSDLFQFACECSTLGSYLNFADKTGDAYQYFKKSAEVFAMLYEQEEDEETLIHLGAVLMNLYNSHDLRHYDEVKPISQYWEQRKGALHSLTTIPLRTFEPVSTEKVRFEGYASFCEDMAISCEFSKSKDVYNLYHWYMQAAQAYVRLIAYTRSSDCIADLLMKLINIPHLTKDLPVERDILMEKALAIFHDDYAAAEQVNAL